MCEPHMYVINICLYVRNSEYTCTYVCCMLVRMCLLYTCTYVLLYYCTCLLYACTCVCCTLVRMFVGHMYVRVCCTLVHMCLLYTFTYVLVCCTLVCAYIRVWLVTLCGILPGWVVHQYNDIEWWWQQSSLIYSLSKASMERMGIHTTRKSSRWISWERYVASDVCVGSGCSVLFKSHALVHQCTHTHTHTDKHVDTCRCTQSGHTQTDTNKPMDTNTWKHVDVRGADTHTWTQAHGNTQTHTDTHTHGHKHMETYRHRQAQTHRNTQTHTDALKWTHTETHTFSLIHICITYVHTYVCTCILSKIDIDLAHLCRKLSSLLVTTVAFLFWDDIVDSCVFSRLDWRVRVTCPVSPLISDG